MVKVNLLIKETIKLFMKVNLRKVKDMAEVYNMMNTEDIFMGVKSIGYLTCQNQNMNNPV